jgi:aspartate/methionine/tyrosine aminotransferase
MRNVMTTLSEPIISPAKRSKQPVNPIRMMCRKIPTVNKERQKLGLDPLIDLTIGQPHIPMNTTILDKLIERIQEMKKLPAKELAKEMGYSHSAGMDKTREIISKFYNFSFPEVAAQNPFTKDEVLVCNGAAGGMTLALKTLIEEGDEVAVASPCFPAYNGQVQDTGGSLVKFPISPESSYANTLEQCLSQHPKVKAVIWNDPNNPLGTKHNTHSLNEIATVFRKYPNIIIIHDEVYRELVHNGEVKSLINIAPDLKNRSIIIRSLAKEIAGAPGIRGGMLSAPTKLLSPSGEYFDLTLCMSNEQLRDIVSINVFTQETLIIALEEKMNGNSNSWEKMIQGEYSQNIQFMRNILTEKNFPPMYEPEGAFYILCDAKIFLGKTIPDSLIVKNNDNTGTKFLNIHDTLGTNTIKSDIHISTFLLHIGGVATVPASGFGMNEEHGALRISCANTMEKLQCAAERMAMAYNLL